MSRSKIYTKTGDAGHTSLADGARVHKTDLRVEAYGAVDEANSFVGLARSFTKSKELSDELLVMQHRLLSCSCLLALPTGSGGKKAPCVISDLDVEQLEKAIDGIERRIGTLREFVLPGGTKAAGLLDVARTVIRRAERRVLALRTRDGDLSVSPAVLRFLNRASDYLFMAARLANHEEGQSDVPWSSGNP